MRAITLQVVVMVLISVVCCANASWMGPWICHQYCDDDDMYSNNPDVFGDSEDDFDHDILDKDEFDLCKECWTRKQILEQKVTKRARDFMWIGNPKGDPHDIDLRSDKFRDFREQMKEVLEMDEEEDPEPDYPWSDVWINEKGEEWVDFFYLRDKEPSSYFWRITSQDTVPSYILGTVRVPYAEVFSKLPENIKRVFEVSVKL